MDTEILLEIKPKYIDWERACAYLINPGFISIGIAILYIAAFIIPCINSDGNGFSLAACICTVIIIILVLQLLILSILLFLDKKNYEVTIYKVFSDRIEFEEGFINHKYTTIRMIDIKEIHLDRNFIQRKAELGTIRFITAANNSTTSTGVCFRDIQNSMAVYTKIKQIHEQS